MISKEVLPEVPFGDFCLPHDEPGGIVVRHEIVDSPKVAETARALGVSQPEVIGLFIRLALAVDGDGDAVGDLRSGDIEALAGWTGRPGVFVAAMRSMGWCLPDWGTARV